MLTMRTPRSIKLDHMSSIIRQIQIMSRALLKLNLRSPSIIIMRRLFLEPTHPTLGFFFLFLFILAVFIPIIMPPISHFFNDSHIEILVYRRCLLFPFVEVHFEFVPGQVSGVPDIFEGDVLAGWVGGLRLVIMVVLCIFCRLLFFFAGITVARSSSSIRRFILCLFSCRHGVCFRFTVGIFARWWGLCCIRDSGLGIVVIARVRCGVLVAFPHGHCC
mmetsp:Transcript_317/g.593  ORF Transcript_317/g.593 Transcript_317/m.593 type:complete len:218 (-) Transcript_317:13-666(-)